MQPGSGAVGRQVLRQGREDQGVSVALEGGPGKSRIQRAFRQQPTLGILSLQEGLPPVGGKPVPLGRDEVQERRQVERAFGIHGGQDRYPAEALFERQNHGSGGHPGCSVPFQ
jgi:hypothetical protein